ncbi:MAG: TauD/TfdA family dioxygenase [Alphaproteobacteria bacterium]|nr:TauD/TfdA family dioxygenase [Alphaproteobacteria bacterium]
MATATPTPIAGPSAWQGDTLLDDTRWRFALTEADVAELHAALAVTMQKGQPWQQMTKADFPLIGLRQTLAALAEELENGSGLANLSGLPVAAFGDGLRHLWHGIGLHMGSPVFQDCNALLMRDITDEAEDTDSVLGHKLTARDGSSFKSSKARTLSNALLRFHTDRCDVVALLCIRQAPMGGVSRIASSAMVHNTMLDRHPDLAALLYAPYHRARLGEERGGELLSYALPVFGQRDGRFTSHYSRTYVEAAQEMLDVPRMTAAHWQALDTLHDLAEELCMEITMQPGDMQFINNHVIYHARTAYEDHPGATLDQRRCLHRLWLSMPNSRALPKDQAVLWRNTDGGAHRGGIAQA